MNYENILVEREDNFAMVTINRPQVLNALSVATIDELLCAVDDLDADEGIRAIIVTGAGEKAFVAGADINELRALAEPVAARQHSEQGQRLLFKLEAMDKPVIMAINGYALGGGCELAMAGDIRLAAENAQFGQPEINLGIIPGYGGTQRMARLAGEGTAKMLVFTGERIGAGEALRIGLVDKVVPAAELMETAKALARTLASKAPIAISQAKRAIHNGLQMDLQRGCTYETSQFALLFSTEDRVEGMAAFLEKRKPQFRGK